MLTSILIISILINRRDDHAVSSQRISSLAIPKSPTRPSGIRPPGARFRARGGRCPDRRLRAGGTDAGGATVGFPDIKTCIVEQKPGPLLRGQADGIACRTMEMFHAFGFSERVLKEAYWINETTFWKPDDRQPREHRPQRPGPGRRRRAVGIPARRSQPGAGARFLSRRHAQIAVAGSSRTMRGACRSADRAGAGGDAIRTPVTVTARAARSRARGADRNGQGALRGRLRRRAQHRAHVDRARASRRFRQPRLGRDGRAGRHRFPGHPLQVPDPVRQ